MRSSTLNDAFFEDILGVTWLKAGGGLLIYGLLKAAFVLGVLVAESFDGVATFSFWC